MKRLSMIFVVMSVVALGQLQWSNRDVKSLTVKPEDGIGVIEFTVDTTEAGGDVFDVRCSHPAAVVKLEVPGGAEIDATNAEGQGYGFAVVEDAAFALGDAGRHTIITLAPASVPGIYKLKIDASAAPEAVNVLVTYAAASSVVAGLVAGSNVGQTGQPLAFTGMVREGERMLGELTARLIVREDKAGAAPEVVTMAADAGLGEGVQLGIWTPQREGDYLAVMRVSGRNTGGLEFARTATTRVKVMPAMARMTAMRDLAVDENGDGKLEHLAIASRLRVSRAGRYQLTLALTAANEKEIEAKGLATLDPGDRELRVIVPANDLARLESDGPFVVSRRVLTCLDTPGLPLDTRMSGAETAAYRMSDFGAAPERTLSVAPVSLSFPATIVGATSELELRLINPTDGPVEVNTASISPAVFRVVLPVVAPAQGEARVQVRYVPSAAGNHTGTLTLAGVRVALSGTATAAAPVSITFSRAAVDFGNVTVGEMKEETLTVRNTGTAALRVAGLTVAGASFSVVSPAGAFDLAAGATVEIRLRFRPAAEGGATGSLSYGSQRVTLSGTGVAAPPVVSGWTLEPETLDFGTLGIGEAKTLSVKLVNRTGKSLTVTSVTFSQAGFTLSGVAAPVTIEAGESRELGVRLSMILPMDVDASMRLYTSDATKPTGEVRLVAKARR